MSKAYDRIAKKTPLATRLEVLEDMAKIDKMEIERLKKELEKVKNLGLDGVSQQREFLDWLSNEPDHNIRKSDIEEILQDFKYYQSNCG
jgi:hypothetical protein